MRKVSFLVMFICLITLCNWDNASAEKEIICASTTSTENSGLFSSILPVFEKKTGITVKVVARGTGAAIEMGKRGDADMVMVHAKE